MAELFRQESGLFFTRHMLRLGSRAPSIAFAFLFVVAALATHARAAEDKTLEWIQDILLGTEYGESEAVVVRWVKSPTIAVYGADSDQFHVIEGVVAELNDVLAKTLIEKATLRAPNDGVSDIEIVFAPLADFDQLARERGFTYFPGNWGYFWVFWNARHEIFRAHVLLASDRLKGSDLRHFALEEITQALGPSNDSAEFSESIFFESEMDGGDAQHLSQNDRRLVIFLYQYLTPGARRTEVVAAYREHWSQ